MVEGAVHAEISVALLPYCIKTCMTHRLNIFSLHKATLVVMTLCESIYVYLHVYILITYLSMYIFNINLYVKNDEL